MGFVGTYDSRVRVVEGRVCAGCGCDVIVKVPDCDSYPLEWLVEVTGMLSLPNARRFGAGLASADPDGRIICSTVFQHAVARLNFVHSDGTYTVPYISTSGGLRKWEIAGLEYESYHVVSTTIVSEGVFDDTTLTITIAGCITGPGDVTIDASYAASGSLGSIFSWSKTITLLSGQKLTDLGTISLDPLTPTFSGIGLAGASYTLNASCNINTGAAMTAHPNALLLTPA